MRARGGRALAAHALPPLRAASTLVLLALACASPALVVRTEAPPLAARFAPREPDAVARPWPARWLVVVLAPELPGPFDADVPDLAERAEHALRTSGFAVVARLTLASPPSGAALAERAAEGGADGAIFVRLVLRRQVRQTHALRYLASTATFGVFPWAVMHDQLDYALEAVAVGAGSGALLAEVLATRGVGQDHTLWQTAEGEILGWDVGEALGGARQRRRALESELAEALLAEAAAALAPASARVPLLPRDRAPRPPLTPRRGARAARRARRRRGRPPAARCRRRARR
jgi:hypothetical protein